jgi:hypothetical protein
MSDNTLAVKITADVVGLQAKAAIARAELSATTGEMNKLAKAAASSGTGAITPDLLAASQAAATARGRLTEINAELGKVKPASDGAFGSLKEGFRISGENLDHLSLQIKDFTGIFTKFGEVLAIGFGIEKVVGLAEAFAQYGAQVSRAMEQTGMTATQLSSLDLVAKENDVDFQTLSRTMTIFARNIQEAQQGALKQALSFQALGISQKELTEHGNDMSFMLQRVAQALNQYQAGQAKLALETNIFGGRVEGLSAILKDIAENGMAGVERHAKELGVAIDDKMAAKADNADKKFKDFGATVSGFMRSLGASWTVSGVTDAITSVVAALSKGQADLNRFRDLSVSTLSDLSNQAGKTIPIPSATGGAAGGGSGKEAAPALPDLAGEVAKMRTDSAQIAATWDGLQSGMLAKQRATVEQTRELLAQQLGDLKEKSTEYQSVVQEEARLDAQIRRTSGEEALASTHEAMSAINAQANVGQLQRLQQEKASLDQLLASHKLNAAQTVEVTKEQNNLIASINRESLTEQTQISQINADTQIAVSRLHIEAKKAALEADLQNNVVNADQKYQILKQLTTDEFNLDRKGVEDRLKLLDNQPVEQARVAGELKVVWEKYYEDLARLDQQRATEQHKAQADEVKGWKSAVGEITSSEKTFLSDYLTGRKTAGQSVIALVDSLALKEIQSDAAAVTTRLLLANTEEAKKKALEEGGFLFHLLSLGKDTGATVAAQTEQTAAVAAGEQAKVAAKTAAAAESKAASAAIGSSTVMADAAKAAAGAYSAVAGIPYVGPVLAPVAAGVAFEAVAAYSSLASSEGGDWNVDATRFNIVHPRETIMPASVAGPMRDYFSGGGARSASGASFGDTNFTNHFHQTMVTPNAVMAAMETAHRNGHPAFKRMARV